MLNIVPEGLLDKLWVCSKAFPKGVSEIEKAGLTERKSKKVKSPSIEECVGWIECQLEFEKEAGDHILVVGRVVHAECKDEFMAKGEFDVSKAKPVMHIRGRRFVVAERVVTGEGRLGSEQLLRRQVSAPAARVRSLIQNLRAAGVFSAAVNTNRACRSRLKFAAGHRRSISVPVPPVATMPTARIYRL